MEGFDLSVVPVHLGLGATAEELVGFEWDEESLKRYEAAHAGDGDEGRLVVLGGDDADWDAWERHPAGDELVVCVAGQLTLVQELGGAERHVPLSPGRAAINPRGVWHTADVQEPSRMLYVTPGRGTEHRPR